MSENKKWLVLAIYKPPQQNSRYFVEQMSKWFDQYSRYDNVVVFGDFNLEPDDIALSSLINDHGLYNMIKTSNMFQVFQGPLH